MEQADGFVFMSLYHFIHPQITSEVFDYTLKLINPFELLFIAYIAWGLSVITKQPAKTNLLYIFKGYGIPLLFYAGLKIFINVFFLKI